MRRRIAGFVSALLLIAFVWACVVWRTSYLPGASPVPSTFGMQSGLARVLPALKFDAVGLSDVIDFMRDVSGSNIDVDWGALKRAGVDRNTPASAAMRNVTLGEGLMTFLKPLKLTVYTGDGAIQICPEGQQPREWNSRRPSLKSGPYDRAMRLTIPSLQFDAVRLDDALNYLSTTQNIPVHVDWQSLNAAGVTKDTPLSFNGRNRSVSADLSSILSGCDGKDAIQYQVRQDGIFISTRAEFDRREPRVPGWKWTGFAIAAALVLALLTVMVLWRRSGEGICFSNAAFGRGMVCVAMVCAAVVGIATWRHGVPFWEYVNGATRWTLTVHHGAVQVYRSPADPAMPYHRIGANSGKGVVVTVKGRGGFYMRQSSWPAEWWNLEVPVWAVVLGTGAGPLIWLATRLRKHRRRMEGRCRQCGYDLRASVGRCPECGAAMVEEIASRGER